MAYQILRQEQEIDGDGNKEIFMSVQVTDETGLYVRGEWLSDDDVAAVVANPDYSDTVASQIAARATASRIIVSEPVPTQGFSVTELLTRLSQVFTPIERLQLAQVMPSFATELQIQDFAAIKQTADYLLSMTPPAISQIAVDKIAGLFSEQGIDISKYSAS